MAVDLEALARRMLADYDDRLPGEQSGNPTGMSTVEAYALQAEITRLRERRGEKVVGYKVGCTSRHIRKQLGVEEPIFGRLFDTGCHPCGVRLLSARYANPAIEGELAIRLSRDLPRDPLTDDEYTAAIESVFPVIELHHFVLPRDAPPLAALIASGGMHAGLVFAERETTCSGRVPPLEELDVTIDVTIDDRLVGATSEPWTMGGPASTLRWLTARLAESDSQLRRGQVILTGSPLPLFPVGPGSRIVAEAGPLGRSSAEMY
jgi:2-keto-4-pentenoate hydratase